MCPRSSNIEFYCQGSQHLSPVVALEGFPITRLALSLSCPAHVISFHYSRVSIFSGDVWDESADMVVLIPPRPARAQN